MTEATERIYDTKIFTGRKLSEVTARYSEWMTNQHRELLAFVATKVELDLGTGVLVVFFQYERPIAQTGVTQRLQQPAPPARKLMQYDTNGYPVIDERHYNVNDRYEIACKLAQHHGRSELFSSGGTLARAYFAGVSDALDAQASSEAFDRG